MRANPIKDILNEVRMSVASHQPQPRPHPFRHSVNASHKSTKLNTIQQGTPNRPTHFRTISNNCKTDKTEQTAPGAKTAGVVLGGKATGLVKGMNDNFLFLRKENHLNTHFNIRKNKLKEITRANKNIYQRLNTQKSFYSNSDLNKSYESTKQIKSRLSQSKLSHRLNSSRSSSRKSLRQGLKGSKKQVKLQIKAKDINKISSNQANKFRGLFIRDLNTKPQSDKEIVKFNSYRKNEYPPNPNPNIKVKASARMSMQPVKQCTEGGILHRVAELLGEQQQGKQNRVRRSSLVMPKSRKLFNF